MAELCLAAVVAVRPFASPGPGQFPEPLWPAVRSTLAVGERGRKATDLAGPSTIWLALRVARRPAPQPMGQRRVGPESLAGRDLAARVSRTLGGRQALGQFRRGFLALRPPIANLPHQRLDASSRRTVADRQKLIELPTSVLSAALSPRSGRPTSAPPGVASPGGIFADARSGRRRCRAADPASLAHGTSNQGV